MNWLQDPLPLPPDPPAALAQNLVAVEVKRASIPVTVTENMTADDAIRVIRSLADELDVTVTISGPHPAGRIMIAISGGNCFLGLIPRRVKFTSMSLRGTRSSAPALRSSSRVRLPRSDHGTSQCQGL